MYYFTWAFPSHYALLQVDECKYEAHRRCHKGMGMDGHGRACILSTDHRNLLISSLVALGAAERSHLDLHRATDDDIISETSD